MDNSAANPTAGLTSARFESVLADCRGLLTARGDYSGIGIARRVIQSWDAMSAEECLQFLERLATEFSPSPEEVAEAAETFRQSPVAANLVRLQQVCEPPRQELFRRLNMAEGGTRFIVDLRRRVLAELGRRPEWVGLDADLVHLLRSWFNRGFLEMRRIDWRTPALILEKLIQYESVHEIKGWRDLRRRLEADRRCYAFFHPALPDEPLIFIEIALTRSLQSEVAPLLDTESPVNDPRSAAHAIFYSITNCQAGLRGISFGNFLIKQVAHDLAAEFPKLRRFATLSPIPGFREWLAAEAAAGVRPARNAVRWLEKIMTSEDLAGVSANRRWRLLSLCAKYLLHARRGAEPLDPVARFHLSNGAQLARLNWLADSSRSALQRAAGIMVNYVYDLANVEKNHEAYARTGEIACSPKFRKAALS